MSCRHVFDIADLEPY